MCGRYTILRTWKQLHTLYRLTTPLPSAALTPRFNVAPSQLAPVVLHQEGERMMDLHRWGLVPSWAKDPAIGNRTINARSETAAKMPAFREAFKRRRCLVPASGFYEWQALEGPKRKQPWYFTPASEDEIFTFAGLWETWAGSEGEVRTFTILTTQANDAVAPVHGRMPLAIEPEGHQAWLEGTGGELPAPLGADRIRARPVGTRVNKPANDDPGCIDPPAADAGGLW